MIPNQSFETYPEFANNGTKTAPDDAKYAAGFAQADVLPAEWMNWAWGKNTRCITALNSAAASIEKEINNVLTAGGATPSVSDNTQLREAIKYIIGTIAAPIAHASTDSTYGLGSTTQFGHVKATAENGLSITNGNIAMDKASTSGYGSSEIIDALTQTTTGDGLALSARQGYVLASNMFGNGTATVNNDEGTIAVTLTNYPNITELMAGARFRVVFTNDFTYDGQATMTINSQLGTAQLVTVGNVANGTGAFQSGKSYEFCYTGANYDCLSIPLDDDTTTNGNIWSASKVSKIEQENNYDNYELIYNGMTNGTAYSIDWDTYPKYIAVFVSRFSTSTDYFYHHVVITKSLVNMFINLGYKSYSGYYKIDCKDIVSSSAYVRLIVGFKDINNIILSAEASIYGVIKLVLYGIKK